MHTCARQVPPTLAFPCPRSTYSSRPVPLSLRSGVTVLVMSEQVQYSCSVFFCTVRHDAEKKGDEKRQDRQTARR